MEHHFVNKFSRFFPSSFTSCQLRSVPDVVESSIPITKNTKILHDHCFQSPKPFSNHVHMNNHPSMIKPHQPKTLFEKHLKVVPSYSKKSLLLGSDAEGRKCPPVTPSVSFMTSQKKEKVKEVKNNKSCSSNSGRWFSSTDDDQLVAEFDGKSDAFFSLSSCSSESFRRKRAQSTSWRRHDNKNIINDLGGRCSSALSANSVNTVLSHCSRQRAETQEKPRRNKSETSGKGTYHEKSAMDDEILKSGCEVADHQDLTELYYTSFGRHRGRKTGKSRQIKNVKKQKRSRKREIMKTADDDHFVVDDSRVEDSYAVEKSSNDPYGDFRTSMVEMIIEKQIFGAKDLEKLLDCFLSLNSSHYHRMIVEVFIEICDTLFGV